MQTIDEYNKKVKDKLYAKQNEKFNRQLNVKLATCLQNLGAIGFTNLHAYLMYTCVRCSFIVIHYFF